MKIRLTLRAKLMLWICGFIPYSYKKHRKRRRTFQWPIEKCIWVIKTIEIELFNAQMKLKTIEAINGPGHSILRDVELRIIFLAKSQIRGYKRLARKKGWIKNL